MSCVLRKLCCHTGEILTELPGPFPGSCRTDLGAESSPPSMPGAGRADRFQGRASLSSLAIYVSSCGDMWSPSPVSLPSLNYVIIFHGDFNLSCCWYRGRNMLPYLNHFHSRHPPSILTTLRRQVCCYCNKNRKVTHTGGKQLSRHRLCLVSTGFTLL